MLGSHASGRSVRHRRVSADDALSLRSVLIVVADQADLARCSGPDRILLGQRYRVGLAR
jgi:hypothetical protein